VGQSVPYTSDQLAPAFQKQLYKEGCKRIFLQPDPIGLDGDDINLYAYVANNPVNYTDPNGEFINPTTAAVVIGIGYIIWQINWWYDVTHPDNNDPCLGGSPGGSQDPPFSPGRPRNFPPYNPGPRGPAPTHTPVGR